MSPMPPHRSRDLRAEAEAERLRRAAAAPQHQDGPSTGDLQHAIHDLQVHQIELEMQNDELRRAYDALEVARSRYSDLYDLAPVGYVTISDEGVIREANLKVADMLGGVRSALIAQPLSRFIVPEDQDTYFLFRRRLFDTGTPQSCEVRLRAGNETFFWARIEGTTAQGPDGAPECRAVISDVTTNVEAEAEHQKLQAQLLQSQKMESIGRLAGGVAHDFNNMLGAILGYAEMALEEVSPTGSVHADLIEIQKAAQRSADLTHQLLAFARKQVIAPRIMDLNGTIAGLLKMLRRLIGEDIELTWKPAPGLWTVRMDPSQVDQILANLCVNARDAIAGVGKITIETSHTVFDEAYCAEHQGTTPGEFVRLVVNDSGAGMEKDVLAHLFEPFFTTKRLGKGTGLGLATVYGIVKQNDGFIDVSSDPVAGTTFSIYLPRHTGEAELPRAPEAPIATSPGRETVLLVEDEPAMLNVARTALTNLGYQVLAAATPGEAIRLAQASAEPIRVLLTDVIMPEMNGRDLSRRLTSAHPGLTCVFMSGYPADVIAHRGVLDEGVLFIQKPFSIRALAAAMEAALAVK